MERREFIKDTGLLTTGLVWRRWMPRGGSPVLAKKIDPAWVRSLYARGSVTTYLQSRGELSFIGMPAGGIQCGTVYLGGDGRLWLWDIFNRNQEGIEPKELSWSPDGKNPQKVLSRDGACYVQPSHDIRPLEQGFAVLIAWEGHRVIRKLEAGAWKEIAFEATYPLATVRYEDPDLPVRITLEAGSPFIALNEEDSGLPATMMSFRVHNTSAAPVQVTLLGWLENKSGLYSAQPGIHERVNEAERAEGYAMVTGSIRGGAADFAQRPDVGTLAIAALGKDPGVHTDLRLPLTEVSFRRQHAALAVSGDRLLASVFQESSLPAGGHADLSFVIAWHFPNLVLEGVEEGRGRYYQNRFADAASVIRYIQRDAVRLRSQSRLWKETWYDSTLPWWFLERTFLNVSTLATTTCHRLPNGRFWAWEGIGACPGNCTHVWQYAQASGRIFPALERDTRQRVDLGLAQQPDGGIWFRAELEKRPAIDGQAGTVLRFYREHQICKDRGFLEPNWPHIKRAVAFLLAQDRNGDGMEDTPMENTLDAVWAGEIAWIVGLCIAAVRAGQVMAEEMDDHAFAATCKDYVDKGRGNMENKLFNGEYFIHRPDPVEGRKKLGSYDTSHIDQVLGQSWAFQVGLGRVLDRAKTLSALRSLWKYNFTTDVGPYIQTHRGGRPYALPGEGGMIMNTNPLGETKPYGEDVTWQVGYFNECMSGFEHQVAAHMMAEGMTDEALILTRTIHDRYHASKRNPFNEIECSDHYARAMASYGTFITACGFEYHGPKGYIRFAPRLSPDRFKAPFTAAEGWGSYAQERRPGHFTAALSVKYGRLVLNEWGASPGFQPRLATVAFRGGTLTCGLRGDTVILPSIITLEAGEEAQLTIR